MRKFKIGVFGSAGGTRMDGLRSSAGLIGRGIAQAGCIMVTGGCPGLPHEAALEANESGGTVIGISPAMNLQQHTEGFKFPAEPYLLIFTGMERKGRNIINTRTCDGAIFISGRTGTLNEFTSFYDEATQRHVVGLLRGSGGVVDEVIAPYLAQTEKQGKAMVIAESDPSSLVRKVHSAIFELNA